VKRLSDGKLIVAIVLLLALQAALTAGLQVYGLEPTWTGNWRILKAILAAVNWGGGLCLAFYLRVRWPHWFAWLVVALGVLAVGAFYSAWYSSWASLQSWVGMVYGLLMAAFDASLVGYGLTVIGKESKQAEAQAEAEAAHKREMERREAETKQARAEASRTRAETELEQARTASAVHTVEHTVKRVESVKVQGELNQASERVRALLVAAQSRGINVLGYTERGLASVLGVTNWTARQVLLLAKAGAQGR